ncbi:sphingosine-1-phosphate lyase 1-like [Pecten maximus]|uniref:sphingosine-1-phosphate lyase 1-like n=1 Tax=Pecten maximus TaxID=6579 RepID=UPI001458A9E5|nr:sphingosine-1-phosphate lyase 1-like [Pecten maximus]
MKMAKLMDVVTGPAMPYLDMVKDKINSLCDGLQPWQVVVYSCGGTLVFVTIKNLLFNEEQTLKKRTLDTIFRYVKMIPLVKKKVAEEKNKMLVDMEASFHKSVDGYQKALPATGLKMDEVEKLLLQYKSLAQVDWENGQVSGTVYSGDAELTELMAKTYGMFAWSNPLHPDVFPDVRKMEAEVVRMCCTMFNGDDNTCGTMSSGGSESILLACLTYRNIARDNGVNFPEMIVPVTVHAAFDKAAFYFRMKITHIPSDKVTGKVDIKAMRRAINKNTCMLVGSAPGFPHGIIDDIEEIAALGHKYNIPVHVDCCLGGFLVPFMEKAGYPIPVVDFRLPGVTSISADTHKYGFAPKGSSVILYRKPEYRQKQFFVQPEWPGGIYATSTTGGSRAGAIIAACWATMMHIGLNGYVESTRKIIKTARYITKGLREIEGLVVYGEPLMSVVGMGSDRFNIFRLADILTSRGYNLNALQYPDSLHLCCTLVHTKEGMADKFLSDVRNAVEEILQDPQDHAIGGMGAIYGMAQSIPDKKMVGELAGCYLEAMYSTNKE